MSQRLEYPGALEDFDGLFEDSVPSESRKHMKTSLDLTGYFKVYNLTNGPVSLTLLNSENIQVPARGFVSVKKSELPELPPGLSRI